MRFIHTSDWHLGRILHGVHLTDDQSVILEQFVDLVKNEKPDAVLIAGDIFDRAVPPPEAVTLLDEVLSRLILDLGTNVLLIAGNHDSPERLKFGSKILSLQKLHVVGGLESAEIPLEIYGANGEEVLVYSVPYVEPPVVRQIYAQADEVKDHNAAMHLIMERIRQQKPKKKPAVVMTHAFVTGGETCESERPLSVGGSGSIDASCFEGFDYVALGHLHRPQKLSSERIQYSGSLMKYSFSEAKHRKSVSIVNIDPAGVCTTEKITLTPRRDVRCISGKLSDLLQRAEKDAAREDYLCVELTDDGAIFDAIGQLREAYPHVLQIERPFVEIDGSQVSRAEDHRKVGELQLFSDFYSQVTGDDITEEQAAVYSSIMDDLRRREREGVA